MAAYKNKNKTSCPFKDYRCICRSACASMDIHALVSSSVMFSHCKIYERCRGEIWTIHPSNGRSGCAQHLLCMGLHSSNPRSQNLGPLGYEVWVELIWPFCLPCSLGGVFSTISIKSEKVSKEGNKRKKYS